MSITLLKQIEPAARAAQSQGETSPTHWWLRAQDGSYRRIAGGLRGFRAAIRPYGRDADDVMREAFANFATVQFIAGRTPGVYHDEHGRKVLVPEYVPPVVPPAAPDPPPSFLQLAEDLHCVLELGDLDMARLLRAQMMEIYRESRGAAATRSMGRIERLVGGRAEVFSAPFDDHCRMFREEQGLIWTSQPYLDKVETLVPEVVGFAHQHGLVVTVSPKWSWYYPGKTMLLEWRRAEPSAC